MLVEEVMRERPQELTSYEAEMNQGRETAAQLSKSFGWTFVVGFAWMSCTGA